MISWISYIYFPKKHSFSVRGDRWPNILLWTLGIVYVIKIPRLPAFLGVFRRLAPFRLSGPGRNEYTRGGQTIISDHTATLDYIGNIDRAIPRWKALPYVL